MQKRFLATDVKNYLTQLFETRGLTPVDANCIADALTATSLRGVDTHGVRLSANYIRLLDAGLVQPKPRLTFEKKTESIFTLDADNALGHIAGFAAVEAAVAAAKSSGIGLVVVRNSSHFGAAACYTIPIASANMVGFAATNSDDLVVPFGGKNTFFGTNPLAVAAKGDGADLFSLDMATSQISISRVKMYQEENRPLKHGWAVDAVGQETCDPSHARSLLPLGGYKGSGLAFAVQILTALLADGPFDAELEHVLDAKENGSRAVSHIFLALDIARFVDPAHFRRRLSQLLKNLRSVSAVTDDAVKAPGDLELIASAERSLKGLPIDEELLSIWQSLAPGLACPSPL